MPLGPHGNAVATAHLAIINLFPTDGREQSVVLYGGGLRVI
jgi:hypothetical protein